MTEKMKKITGLMLAIVMIGSMFPFSVASADTEIYTSNVIGPLVSEETEEDFGEPDPTADLETEEDFIASLKDVKLKGLPYNERLLAVAETQLGYSESESNFIVKENEAGKKEKVGYTRYGAWYGAGFEYESWCAMFISFCLHYAEVPEKLMPIDSGVITWIHKLQTMELYQAGREYLPKGGDFVFFDFDHDGYGDHVGIVTSVFWEDGVEMIGTIEGNHSTTVETFSYPRQSLEIMGYGVMSSELPEDEREKQIFADYHSVDGNTYRVTMSYTPDAGIPDGSVVIVREILPSTGDYANYVAETEGALGWEEGSASEAIVLDISIYADGVEVQPAAPVSVELSLLAEGEEDWNVVHFGEEAPQVLESTSEGDTVTFETEGFSIFVFAKAVIEKTLDASDGNTYKITVTYDSSAGIPEGAQLDVAEITEDSPEYQEYVSKSENAVGVEEGKSAFVRLFDIKILDKNGEKIEISAPVDVKIELMETGSQESTSSADTQVVHFADNSETGDVLENVEVAGSEEAEEGVVVSFETEGFSIFAVIGTITTQYITADGETYNITVTYDKSAGIPEGAQLDVAEITEESPEYQEFVSKSENAVGVEEGKSAFVRLFDIKILDENGQKVEIIAPVDVKIELAETGNTEEKATDTRVVHFADDAEEGNVLENVEVAESEKSEEGVVLSFETDGFSVFAVIGITIEKNVLASDGHNYKISVTFGEEAGVPEGASLEVSELTDESELYEEYVTKTEDALGMEEGSASNIRLFDIKIVDQDGQKVEITAPVDVKIEMLDVADESDAQVVHFADGAEVGDVVGNVEVNDGAISFEAEGFSVYSIVTPTTVVDLDGKEFALITWDGGKTGKGLTGDLHQNNEGNLCAEFLTVMTKMSGNKQLQLFVPNNSNEQVTTWTFLQQNNNIFKLKAKIYSRGDDGKQVYVGDKYLKIDSDGKLSMVDDESDASEITVNLQTSGVHKGQICLKCNGKTLTYSGVFAEGFNTSGTTGKEWLYLAETKPESELVGYQRTYTAQKISVSDSSLTPLYDGDTKKVIIYTRVWNGSGYIYFAINGNGELVRCHESGDEIEWMGSGLDELQWKFTEYGNWTTVYQTNENGEPVLDGEGNPIPELLFDDDGNPVYETDTQGNYVLDNNGDNIPRIKQVITPNYYYELQNAYTGQYLAPLISANQILSSDTIGLNMNGRRNGQYYTPILAWDEGNYSFASIEADLDANTSAGAVIHPCARVDGMDLYFAIINDLEADDELHTVPTVDNNMYGITMRMANYSTYKKGSGCDTSQEQTDVLGNDKYDSTGQTPDLLSTKLGTDGYPIAIKTNRSLSELYTAKSSGGKADSVGDVNHLFVESTYKATGYYEYDSTQNYAYLAGGTPGDFTVYQEIGTSDGSNKPTLKHGQFFPFSAIEPGDFVTQNNPRNLYTAIATQLPTTDPRYNEQLYRAHRSPYQQSTDKLPVDYWFGMELTAGFYQTPSGLDAWGHDIIFEFSGDDDFWLYVDEELVIDLGGIHSALPASVNFRTGKVTVNNTQTTLLDLFIQNKVDRGEYADRNAAITALVYDPGDLNSSPAGKTFVKKVVDGENQYTFLDNTPHKMRIFYMERGAGASNLHMKFNLAAVERGTVQLSKEVDVGEEDMSNSVLATFPYQIWYKDPLYNAQSTDHNEEYVQLTEQTLGNSGSVKYLGSTNEVTYKREIYVDNTYKGENDQVVQCSVRYEGVYLVNPGETIVITFPVFGETGQEKFVTEYKIVECGVDPNVYPDVTLDDGTVPTRVSVNTTIRVTERNPETGLPTATGVGRPTVDGSEVAEVNSGLCNYEIKYDSPDNRSKVKYKNKVEETEELLIQKNLYKKEGSAESVLIPKSEYYDDNGNPKDPNNPDLKTTYDFRAYFKTPYDTDYSPANVYQYYVKDAGGYYCKWHPADTSSSNPNAEGSQGYFERILHDGQGVSNFDDLTDDTIVDGHVVHGEKFAATFDTSINGSISKIPAYYTVELQGLIPGTQFKVIERPNETPEGYEFYRYELDGTPVVPYSNVSDVSAGDNRVTAANFASRWSKLYTKDAGGEYLPLSDGDTFDPNKTYYEVDPWVGVMGTIAKDEESKVLVDNYKGYALRLYKTWKDASTMANRKPAYFAVYYEMENQDGEIVSSLVDGSVRRLEYKDNPQELYWFYMHLPPVTGVTDPVFRNYVVREVALTGNGITVNNEGAVIGYETINVVENGGNVTIQGLSNSQGAQWEDIAYKVTYTKTQTVGTSLRKFWVTDTPTGKPAVKFLKEDWSGNPLEGARFTLTHGDTQIFDKVSVKETENSNQAVISIEHLDENKDYVLKETQAPQGYYGLHENLTFQLVSDPSIGWTLNVTPNTGDILDYYDVGSEQVTETIDGQEVVTEYVTLTIKDRPYDFKVIKEDAVDHTKLKNVEFTLWEWRELNGGGDWAGPMQWDDGNPETDDTILKTDNYGIIPHIDNTLPAGTYQLRENKINNRYYMIESFDFTISPTGKITLVSPPDGVELLTSEGNENQLVYTMTVPNTPKPLKLKKVDNSNPAQPLTGAKFKLTTLNASNDWVVVTDKDGHNVYDDVDMTSDYEFEFSDLPAGRYRLEETLAPNGYLIMTNYVYFKINSDRTVGLTKENGSNGNDNTQASISPSSGVYTITVKNTPGIVLPKTGGAGTAIWSLVGGMMSALAGALLVLRKKKRFRRA